MILLADPADPRLAEAPGEPLILAAVQGLAKTVGPVLRRELWLALDGEDRSAGTVCRIEGGLWATVTQAAAGEAAAFLTALGEPPAIVDRLLASRLPGPWTRCAVMEYRGPLPPEPALAAPSAMALADCNVSAGALPAAGRDGLYAELHLRARRGPPRSFWCRTGGGIPPPEPPPCWGSATPSSTAWPAAGRPEDTAMAPPP